MVAEIIIRKIRMRKKAPNWIKLITWKSKLGVKKFVRVKLANWKRSNIKF